jgi:protein-S-isoprenylcysteine O-methyltransferase Ste14
MNRLLNNFTPALVWVGYHIAVPNWRLSFFSLLMLLRAGVVLYCFLIREQPKKRAPTYQAVIAWISTFLPVLMVWEPNYGTAELLGRSVAICGMLLFVFACLDLGKSFGASPAVRAPVSGGIYRFVNHPMYVAHVIAEIGILIASPTAWNFSVALVAWALYAVRAHWESELYRSFRPESKVTGAP